MAAATCIVSRRTICLHGILAEQVGIERISSEIATPAEAVRMLLANFPALESRIRAHDWIVRAGRIELGAEELGLPIGSCEEIHFIPVIQGAGAGGRIVTGALLIGASFLVPGAALAGIALGPVMFGIGTSLLLGGVSQLLTPKTPTAKREKDPKELRSYSINGVQNTSRQGVPVNAAFGEVIIGGIVISAGVTTANLPAAKKKRSKSYGSPRSGGAAAGKGAGGAGK